MKSTSRTAAVKALPLTQTYRSLKEAFAQAIELEMMLAQCQREQEAPSLDMDQPASGAATGRREAPGGLPGC